MPGAAARYNRLARERERERHKILKSYIQQTTCKEHSLLLRLLLLFCCMTEVGRAGGRPPSMAQHTTGRRASSVVLVIGDGWEKVLKAGRGASWEKVFKYRTIVGV